jgi:cytochrome P450
MGMHINSPAARRGGKDANRAGDRGRVPPHARREFRAGEDLLDWMGGQFRACGDIFQTSLYGIKLYATRDAGHAYHTLVERWQNYVKGQNIERVALLLGDGLMVSEGELWKRQRRMMQPQFNHKALGPLVKLISDVNLRLLSRWELTARRNEPVNVTRDVSSMALEVVLRFILGEDYEQVGPKFDLLNKEPARNMAFARSFRMLGKDILQVIERRRNDPAAYSGALAPMMQARDPLSGKAMGDQQLIDEILTLIVAGHETTASTLNWTWYLLSQHRQIEQKLWNELDGLPAAAELEDLARFVYTRQIIEEVMRLYPAGWLLTRRALNDDWLGEYFLPAKMEVYIPIYFIQRHPDLWNDPDRFDPDRFRPENPKPRHRLATMPFSAGPRNCIGQLFARIEMQIHLATIARRLRLRYEPTRPVEMEPGVNLRSKYDFIMYPEAR